MLACAGATKQNCKIIQASSWDYGTYHISDQRRLKRACAFAPSLQSLQCSRTWSMKIDEGSNKKQTSSPTGWLRMRIWRMNEFTEDKKYHTLMSWLIHGQWWEGSQTLRFGHNFQLPPLHFCIKRKICIYGYLWDAPSNTRLSLFPGSSRWNHLKDISELK